MESGYNTYFEQFNFLELCLINADWLFDMLIDDYQVKDCLQPYNLGFREELDRLRFRGEVVNDGEYDVSALHTAVYFLSRLALGEPSKYSYINKLLESGASASIMSRPPLYFSPIHLAIDINDPHALSILLPHASTRDLFSATQRYLFQAAIKKSSEMIQL